MAIFRKHTIGERLMKIIAGGFLLYVAFKGIELQPQVALIIGAIGGLLALSALWKYEKV